LTEMLDNLSSIVRKRMTLKNRVKALTGEGRMQAAVLTVLPIVALIALIILAPEYANTLLERPWLLGTAGGAQLLGIVWIRSIINFDT
ncbi:MAG: type II secretion system protein, partial [Pirellulales bacterium]